MSSSPSGFLPPTASPRASPLERLLGVVAGWLGLAMLIALGLVFVVSLLFWLVLMLVYSLVSSWITGRPATVSLLWQRYRAMARRHWPARRAGRAATGMPGAARAGRAPDGDGVQDVSWREVRDPASPAQD